MERADPSALSGEKKRIEVNALHPAEIVHVFPKRLRHDTPGWVDDGALFHIRIRVDRAQVTPLTDETLSRDLLTAAKRYHDLGYYSCEMFLLMPDHLHALLRFSENSEMPKVIKNWKRGTARFQHVVWQDGFFDYRIRDAADAQSKWRYIRRNPVVKNLCAHEDDWLQWWSGTAPHE